MDDNMQMFRERGIPGSIGFSIVARDTERNRSIHEGFKEFANVECKNDRTLALAKLMDYYTNDAKIEMLWHAIQAMERRLAELEMKTSTPQRQDDDDVKVF